jgi:hypothetical protein
MARQRREEEEMSGYSAQELAEGWEFKIVRSATSAFKRPEFLRQVLEEEKRAGGVLVEKFDNERIRLKRPATARAKDSQDGIDPYRTQVGIGPVRLGLTIAACALGSVAVIVTAIALLVHK